MKEEISSQGGFKTETSSAELSYIQIERYFRKELSEGRLKEGDKLPSNAELAVQFNVSGWTVQNALSRLASEGLIGRARRRGTFVKASGGSALVGVLFGPSLAEESAFFYRAILKTLRQEMQQYNWNCRFYDDLVDERGIPRPVNSPAFQHLLSDFRNYPFKGIVEFATGAQELEVLEKQSGLPHVRYAHSGADVLFDERKFGLESAQYFAEIGRKNIAILTTRSACSKEVPQDLDEDELCREAVRLGMPAPKTEVIQLGVDSIDQQEELIYQQCLKIAKKWVKKPGKATPPDALFITDDIITRSMALALIQMNIRVPEDLHVVSLANEGIDINYGIPVVRYEFSPREMSRNLLDILWRKVMNRATPSEPVVLAGRMIVGGTVSASHLRSHSVR